MNQCTLPLAVQLYYFCHQAKLVHPQTLVVNSLGQSITYDGYVYPPESLTDSAITASLCIYEYFLYFFTEHKNLIPHKEM